MKFHEYTSRKFYNLLELFFFYGHLIPKTTWNVGIVEYWNIGYEKRKTPFYSNNVESTSFDDVRQTSIFCLLLSS
jgi:hypothetical protein